MDKFIRLDLFLFTRHKIFSRGFIQKFIKEAGVKINGKLVKKPHHPVRESDNVDISEKNLADFLNSKSVGQSNAPAKRFTQIYSNKDFFVIDKPPFIKTEDITKDFFVVHRLDKNTSGVLVIAKNPVVQAALQKSWQEKKVKKIYLALVKGTVSPKKGAIEAGIQRSFGNRRKMTLSAHPLARKSYTEYEVAKYIKSAVLKEDFTFVRVFPKTGRTHQIRVHFAGIGHPILGDEIYGDKELNRRAQRKIGLKRQFLHASELEIKMPGAKKKMVFFAPLPEDLENTKKLLKKNI